MNNTSAKVWVSKGRKSVIIVCMIRTWRGVDPIPPPRTTKDMELPRAKRQQVAEVEGGE